MTLFLDINQCCDFMHNIMFHGECQNSNKMYCKLSTALTLQVVQWLLSTSKVQWSLIVNTDYSFKYLVSINVYQIMQIQLEIILAEY